MTITPTTPIERRLISDAVEARLKTLGGVKVYRVEVPDQPPKAADPNPEGRVGPYAVLYPFAGHLPSDQSLSDDPTRDLVYGCQVSCVAGWAVDCEHLADRVDGLLYLWSPTLTGLVCGRFAPPPGYDPGPAQAANVVQPPRFSIPLNYRTTVTR